MPANAKRIHENLEALSRFNATPGHGLTRFTYTEEHRCAQTYVVKEMEKAGLEVRIDAVGNIFGRKQGLDNRLPPILVGSHIDSVRNGGFFDGAAGVVAGIEVARILEETSIIPRHPVDIVSIVEEEGGRFSSGLFGSRVVSGKVRKQDLTRFKDDMGILIAEAMTEFGLDPEKMKTAVIDPEQIEAFIELHIEQGPVLENEHLEIGIVDSITGITACEVEITGRPDHAGTTPMNMRCDALTGACAVIQQIPGLAQEKKDGTVATVGKMEVHPGAVNIIPGKVTFTFESRSKQYASVEEIVRQIKKLLDNTCREHGLHYRIKKLVELAPVMLSEKIVSSLLQSAGESGISCKRMHSGAGHDAMFFAGITRAGMVFVPSKNGRSHCPEEWSDYDLIAKGTDIIVKTICNYDR